jgi:hypothetical protein
MTLGGRSGGLLPHSSYTTTGDTTATRTLGLSAITAATLVIGGPVSARSFVDDVGAAVSTATGDAGRSVGTAWEQTKAAVHKGAGDTGDLLGKGLDGVNHAAKEVEKVFCDVMTAGKASQGEASCGVNAGVGAETNGNKTTYYTYNPQQPDTHYPITKDQTTLPDANDLAAMDRIFGNPKPLEDWEKDQADQLGNFLKPGDRLGLPWSGMISEVHSPATAWNIRPGGDFMDYRTDPRYPDNRRWHGSLDVLNKVGEDVYALAGGTIARPANPGRPGMMGLEIAAPNGYTIDTFYVQPTPAITEALAHHQSITVKAGDKIGSAQLDFPHFRCRGTAIE